MKFHSTLATIALIAILGNEAEARRKPSPYAVKRVAEVREQLERTYGKGLVGMINPKTGKLDFDRMGWDNKVTGGARMGSQLNTQIGDQIFDATTVAASFLGFSKGMQYSDMARASANALPIDDAQLTNCFASSYALIKSVDIAAFNWKNVFPASGSFKGFDLLITDPMAVFADSMVNFEMCEYAQIIDQAKDMAGLDYASLADNFTREALVGGLDFKPALDEIKVLKKKATDCVKAKAEFAKREAKEAAGETWTETEEEDEFSDVWDIFASMDIEDLKEEAMNCIPKPDKFTIGEISGKLFAKFFDNQLQPLI